MSAFKRPEEVRFEKGKILFSEGDLESSTYLIQVGLVEISILRNTVRKVLDTIGPGGIVGSISVLENGPRVFTATAADTVTAMKLDPADVKSQLNQCTPFMKNLVKAYISRIKRMKGLI
jgi:CRP-like cAMP-binding protein